MRNIAETFYENGGYVSSTDYINQDSYVALDDVTASYIPQGVLRFNRLCMLTISVDYSTLYSDNVMHDTIIAELALSIADSEYDKLHIDPETGQMENKHYEVARRYMLDMYGIPQSGGFGRTEFVLPAEALVLSPSASSRAYDDMAIATMSD